MDSYTFQNWQTERSRKKAFETVRSNTYSFDVYFGRQVITIEKWEGSNLQTKDCAENHFHYNSKQENLADFSEWLYTVIATKNFIHLSKTFLDIR